MWTSVPHDQNVAMRHAFSFILNETLLVKPKYRIHIKLFEKIMLIRHIMFK